MSHSRLLLIAASLSLLSPSLLRADTSSLRPQAQNAPIASGSWESHDAEHAYGFPEAKPKKKGVLTLSADALTFANKSVRSSIPRNAITAVSAGDERIEMWGTGGMLLRMAIPDGGGIAAAALMHHRVDMLTVEFRDIRGGTHSAVFYLPAKEAAVALSSFGQVPYAATLATERPCPGDPVQAGSVLVEAPNWEDAQVPAAYRSLLYEHVVDRLRKSSGVSQVYREGEVRAGSVCPQYTVHLAIKLFKPGNQIVRSSTGPIGMFMGTTKMTFEVEFSDASGRLEKTEEIKVAVRDQTESTGVADKVAKAVAKHYAKAVKAEVAETTQSRPPLSSAQPHAVTSFVP
jgi:hypothetical protein